MNVALFPEVFKLLRLGIVTLVAFKPVLQYTFYKSTEFTSYYNIIIPVY
jgi:hypothetical protein